MFLNIKSPGVIIRSIAHYLPESIVTNQQLIDESGLSISDEWIKKRIGVEQRHRVADDQAASDMAIEAAKAAIAKSNTPLDKIESIIVSTISPDHPNPATACAVQAGLGLAEFHCPCVDISAACSGFIYALDMGARQIMTGAKCVLVVSTEIRSRFINPTDPSTYPIFGDGAAAVILEAGQDGLSAVETFADGTGYHSVHIPAGGSRLPASQETIALRQHYIQMNQGEKIFFEVVEKMTKYSGLFLDKCGLTLDDVDFIIPHQANLNILKEVNRRLQLPEGKMLINIQNVGNISSASIPLALSQFIDQGVVKPGHRVLMIAAGAGHTLALALATV